MKAKKISGRTVRTLALALALVLLAGSPALAATFEYTDASHGEIGLNPGGRYNIVDTGEGQNTQTQPGGSEQGGQGNFAVASITKSLGGTPVKFTRNITTLIQANQMFKDFSPEEAKNLGDLLNRVFKAASDPTSGDAMSMETLRQMLTELQTGDASKFEVVIKYHPNPDLIAAAADLVKAINKLQGDRLSTDEALALADALLTALENGWSVDEILGGADVLDSYRRLLELAEKKLVVLVQRVDFSANYVGTGNVDPLSKDLILKSLGEQLNSGNMQASIRGDLASTLSSSMGVGTYGFDVNLSSGAASGGFMRGEFGSVNYQYDVSGGTGKVNGNDFALSGFHGTIGDPVALESVSSATLNGTAANGFDKVGDIGASGSYDIVGSGYVQDGGIITGGERIK